MSEIKPGDKFRVRRLDGSWQEFTCRYSTLPTVVAEEFDRNGYAFRFTSEFCEKIEPPVTIEVGDLVDYFICSRDSWSGVVVTTHSDGSLRVMHKESPRWITTRDVTSVHKRIKPPEYADPVEYRHEQ